MAILQKRKSTNQLPRFERYQDTRGGDRAAALRGETPITSAVRQLAGTSANSPMVGRGAEGVLGTGAAGFGGRPAKNVTSTLVGNTPSQTGASVKPAGSTTPKTITSTGTGASKTTAPTSSKLPSLTSTGSGAAKTTGTTPAKNLTSAGSGTDKTSSPTNTAKTSSTGSMLGKTLTSALAGAALGVGTKAVVDKLTGGNKTSNTSNTANSGTGLKITGNKNLDTMGGGTGLKTTTNVGGTGSKTTNTAGTGAVTSKVTNPNTGIKTGNNATVGGGPTAPKTGGVTSKTGPVTPKTGATGAKTPAGTGGTRGVAGTAGAATGAATTDDNTSTTGTAVTGVAYDDEGNLMPGYELDEENNPVYVGLGDDTTTGGDDTTTGGDDTTTAQVIDTVDNEDGTTTVTYDDGSTLTTDITGTVIASTDGTDTGEDTTLADNYFTDDEGNVYDANGDLVQYADGTPYEGEDNTDFTYTDEYGNTYDANGDLIAEADHSDFTQQDEYGNTYDYDGNLISYAEGYNPDDYNTKDDTEYASNDDEPIDEGKRGGLFSMAKGGMPHFVDGGFNYGNPQTANQYQAESRLTAADPVRLQSFLDQIPRTETTSNGDPVAENDNGDGTITQYFDDGSSITYDTDGNVLETTDATDTAYTGDQPAVGSSQDATSNRQYFDDGSYIETYDDGSSVTFDAEGNPFRSTDTEGNSELAKTTTYDDEGNQIISDYYGNIVKVLDPDGNVIPLGGGRVNAGPITNTGGGRTGVDLTPNKTPAQIAADKRASAADDRSQQSAIEKLLAGINTNTGAGVTGAVLGALLGNSDLFNSGGGGNNAGIDMSKVGVINPRTTDFGIGPSNYVGYDQYGTPEAMPELYGNELYQNLNAPGFNEVNEGDYARMDAAANGDYKNQEAAPDDKQVEGMKEGGLPQGGLGASQTFYTFGKPVDPMQNLYNPQPAQQQQAPQGMPPQAAQNQQQMAMNQPVQALPVGMPQGAPQGQNMGMGKPPMQQQNPMQTGPQGLKSGGLPAWSNVPITAGRLNFRDGAPVHGAGDGQSDDIPAMLADGEYVIDAETVAQIGNGSTKAGAQALDKFRENIRAHKRSAPVNKIPPKTKALTSYLRGAK